MFDKDLKPAELTELVVEDKKVAAPLTPEQEADVRERIAQNDLLNQAAMENVKEHARRTVNAVTGTTNVEALMQQAQHRDAHEAALKSYVSKFFGRGSSSVLAQKLAKENMAQYRKLKEIAISLGLL